MAGPSSAPSSGNPRIPVALQNIFEASQRGDDVNKLKAPTNGMGFRIFQRSWGGKQKKSRAIKAPITSSLNTERSSSRRNTAADASRKAIEKRKKSQVSVSLSFETPAVLATALARKNHGFCSCL
jgi:hypothetical protein